MKQFIAILGAVLAVSASSARQYTFSVSAADTCRGMVVKRIELSRPAVPAVKLVSSHYHPIASLPKGISTGDPHAVTVKLGTERRRAFAFVSIPAFQAFPGQGAGMLDEFTVDLGEAPVSASAASFAKKTAATSSALATGTWYKIAVPARGVYTIGSSFLQSLGVDVSSINPSTIRLLGNGGTMISENNAVVHPLDLVENAIMVHDGGDGKFDNGDWIAFYAPGPMRWDKDSAGHEFRHVKNLYADSAYYFISFDAGPGLRIAAAPDAGAATTTVTAFDDYAVHEVDLYNPGAFAKDWWGEAFGLTKDAMPSRDFTFPLGGASDSVHIRLNAVSRSTSTGNTMSVTLNNAAFDGYLFDAVIFADDQSPVSIKSSNKKLFMPGAASARFSLSYGGASDAIGYLDYIELNWRHPLAFPSSDGVHQDNFSFRDWRSVAPGAVAGYQLSNAQPGTMVWDVTDPLHPAQMTGATQGGSFSFTQKADVLHEFVALPGTDFSANPVSPIAIGKVENQDLHGVDAPQLVIVTHPAFLAAANRLAEYHREHDGLRTLVATTTQVYNEFSSGGQDLAAIRDMMRYYYLQAGTDDSRMPRYLLLFGDASYDYKDRVPNNTNFVPTYESPDPLDAYDAFTVDDFLGFLDDHEDINSDFQVNLLDIGIGRLPVNTEQQAEEAVDKIISYHAPAALGPWRLTNTYIGDNDDGAGNHLENAEGIAAQVAVSSPFSNDSKIYLEAFPVVATPGGDRSPEVNKAINDQIFRGTFFMNYTGHGSTTTLAHERVLTAEDFSSWKNANKLPFMVTATCDYARYDNPAYVSNGEQMVLRSGGGSIAMLTTTGPVYAGSNSIINSDFLTAQYTRINDTWPTFGDAIRRGKNASFTKGGNQVNFYRFTLLGDPALQPAFPKYTVHTDSIRTLDNNAPTDSLRALGSYTISGHVADDAGNVLNTFNGRAYITIFDKPRTLVAETRSGEIPQHECRWQVRDNVIFKGLTTVTNGQFSFAFIAPKDMGYDFGKGRISYYAENGETDAAGMDTSVIAGGFFDGAAADNDAPIVKPYIGDTLFRDGGITGANTQLYVVLTDKSGINASGNGVGHDITAVLDGDQMHPTVLNDNYTTEPNTYQRGHVSFPVTGLSDGAHTFTVKAWDVYNNSGEGTVHFIVGNGKVLQVQNLNNYPNPFRTSTHFFFEHNHPGEVLNVQIMIYDMRGQRVRLINQDFTPGGSHSNEIGWDGTSDAGAQLGSGVYPYRMILSTESGIQASAYQKLVITR